MKKLINILKKCALVLAIVLVLSNITVPTPIEMNPGTTIAPCTTSEPVENPLDRQDYN